MTNSERAARLAELGFFHIESRMAQSLAAGDGVLDGDILLSLLSELNRRGRAVEIGNTKPDHKDWTVDVLIEGCDGRGTGSDLLIALVDAVIAAERQAT